jgi:hypothetical protein
MDELTEDDIWFCKRTANGYAESGYLVTTKTGLKGRTFHKDELINGKQPVYVEKDGKPLKMLCDPETLIINGYID